MANSSLKLSKVPSAFSPIAAKHNALVDLVKGIEGKGGISVKTSDAKILISVSAAATGAEGDPINVVGSDGKLNLVPKHSTWATPTTYPTELTVVNGTVTASLDSGGLVVENATDAIYLGPAAVSYIGSAAWHLNANGFDYASASITASIGYNGIAWEDANTSSLIDDNGFGYSGAVVGLTLGDVGLKMNGGSVFIGTGNNYSEVSTAGYIFSTASVSSGIDSGGFYFEGAAVTAYAGSGGFFVTDGTSSLTAGIFGLQIDDAAGTVTVDGDGLIWTDGTYKAYIDFEGFTFTGASATGQLGNGFVHLASTTLSVTYSFDRLEFGNVFQHTQISATGVNYSEVNLDAKFGEDGIYWAYSGFSITGNETGFAVEGPLGRSELYDGGIEWSDASHHAYIDFEGFSYFSASTTATLYSSYLNFKSSTTSTTYSQSGFELIAPSASVQLSVDGLVFKEANDVVTVDALGFAYTDGAMDAYVDSEGFTVVSASITSTLNEISLVFDSPTVATTFHRDFLLFDDGTEMAQVSVSGFRYEETGVITGTFGYDGIYWSYGNAVITADDNGIVFRNASVTHTVGPTGIYADFGTNEVRIESTTFLITGASASISIAYASISVPMTLREIDVCNNGSPAKMLIIGSAPY